MKLFTAICVLAISVALVTGDLSEELSSSSSSKCEQCLKVLYLIRETRESSEITHHQINMENAFCESVCSEDNEVDNGFYVDLRDCQLCVGAINKINSHYQGRDPNALSSALSFGCSITDSKCKTFISQNKAGLIEQLKHTKDAYTGCKGIHKC